MPDESVIDGEIVVLDGDGRPSFNLLQNYGSSKTPLIYYAFDVMVLAGENVMEESLETRRRLLEDRILVQARRANPLFTGAGSEAAGTDPSRSKPRDLRAWSRRTVRAATSPASGQELVIGGYTPSLKNFDTLVIGYYDKGRLMYAARTRNGFTPASRIQLFKKLRPLENKECPFANLPEKMAGRWGAGLTAEEIGRVSLVKTRAGRSV